MVGFVITSELKFHKNTEYMDKKSYARMTILKKLYSFSVPVEDLKNIYILYIKSLVEQNVAVWSHTITQEETENLHTRQKSICIQFAKGCLKNGKTLRDVSP